MSNGLRPLKDILAQIQNLVGNARQPPLVILVTVYITEMVLRLAKALPHKPFSSLDTGPAHARHTRILEQQVVMVAAQIVEQSTQIFNIHRHIWPRWLSYIEYYLKTSSSNLRRTLFGQT
jgi:hypothetical protein